MQIWLIVKRKKPTLIRQKKKNWMEKYALDHICILSRNRILVGFYWHKVSEIQNVDFHL